jgi:ATPase subunit of ABC transporter with duplicated ATPase domains
MLFVSYDRHFLGALSKRVLELTPEGIRQYRCGYTDCVARAAIKLRACGADRGMSARGRQDP